MRSTKIKDAEVRIGNTTAAWRSILRLLDEQGSIPTELEIEGLHPAAEKWYGLLKDYAVTQLWSPLDWEVARGMALVWHLHHTFPWDTRYIVAFVQASNAMVLTELSRRRAMIKLRMPSDPSKDDAEIPDDGETDEEEPQVHGATTAAA